MLNSSLKSNRYFGLDLGSNTFSATIIEHHRGTVTVVQDTSYVVRLSEGLQSGGYLKPTAMDRALETLKKISLDFDLATLEAKRAVATQALRVAANADEFVSRVQKETSITVDIISPEQEAMMTARGALVGLAGLDLPDQLLLVDVGGQSTELSLRKNGQWTAHSIPLGVVRLFESHPDAPEAWRREIQGALGQHLPKNYSGSLIAVAGTATTLAMLEGNLSTWDREKVHGSQISLPNLAQWLEKMLRLRPGQRTTQYRIEPGRSDVFPAGLIFLKEIMRQTGLNHLIVSANGLRTGAAISLLEDN